MILLILMHLVKQELPRGKMKTSDNNHKKDRLVTCWDNFQWLVGLTIEQSVRYLRCKTAQG
jgi:hypothetical protein